MTWVLPDKNNFIIGQYESTENGEVFRTFLLFDIEYPLCWSVFSGYIIYICTRIA